MTTKPNESLRPIDAMDRLFEHTVEMGASDLHLVVGRPPILRVSGLLVPVEGAKELTAKMAEELIDSLMTVEEKARFLSTKELDLAHQSPSGRRFRINLHWEKNFPSLAARAIPSECPTLEGLNMPPVVHKMVDYPHGLVLVTGPTGSGKSTSLAAMIDRINETEAGNIITLEDPVEFLFTPKKSVIRQRQFGQDFVSFEDALKHILRQDPDVVMVGEMRDPETIATTLTIAETGHLVFATLHTYSASQTIDRIIDAMPPHQQNQIRSQLALSLRAVISQQLLPREGGGRVAAREILVNNSAIANLIRENNVAQIKNVLQTSAGEGMTTLSQDLKRLISSGSVSRETAQQYVVTSEKLM